MQRLICSLAALAALIGASGVALAAAATHSGGGEMGRTAAYFLILHAASLLGVAAYASGVADRDPRFARALVIVGGSLGVGTVLFAADLAARSFANARLFPMAAPIGGSLMILSWLALAAVFLFCAARWR